MKTAAVGNHRYVLRFVSLGFAGHFRVEQEHWLARTHAHGTQIPGCSWASKGLECKVRKRNRLRLLCLQSAEILWAMALDLLAVTNEKALVS